MSQAHTDPSHGLKDDVVDLGFRTAYRVAHRLLRAYWSVRKPTTHGALVALWNCGQLLLIKNSYRTHYTLPGGYIRDGETAEEAGARELREECRIRVTANDVREVYDGTKAFENRNDRVTIVELELDDRPEFHVDRREVVWAGFRDPADVLAMPIVPHLRDYLAVRAMQEG